MSAFLSCKVLISKMSSLPRVINSAVFFIHSFSFSPKSQAARMRRHLLVNMTMSPLIKHFPGVNSWAESNLAELWAPLALHEAASRDRGVVKEGRKNEGNVLGPLYNCCIHTVRPIVLPKWIDNVTALGKLKPRHVCIQWTFSDKCHYCRRHRSWDLISNITQNSPHNISINESL